MGTVHFGSLDIIIVIILILKVCLDQTVYIPCYFLLVKQIAFLNLRSTGGHVVLNNLVYHT